MTATRREFLTHTTTAALATLMGTVLTADSAEQPNILWIIAEDFCPELGCYGNDLVHSPNIDRLASQGVRFTHAFTNAPVCSASRSGFMVGTYQTTNGGHQHRSHRGAMPYALPGGMKILPHLFKEHGYSTANITKGIPGIKGTGKTDWNFSVDSPFDTNDWTRLKPQQPFFAQINFPETHRAFEINKENPVDPSSVDLPPYYPDHPEVRKDWALYLDDVSHLDRKVGAVLDQLEKDGLADNTVVFFFGDHGRAHVRGKQWCYDDGLHVPLIVRWPGRLKPGSVNDDMVAAIDFAPAVLDIAGMQKPDYLQGHNFLDDKAPKQEYVFSARDRCDETVECIRTVRGKRYRYIRNFRPDRPYMAANRYKDTSYPTRKVLRELFAKNELSPVQARWMAKRKPVEELYDTQTDPHEVNNLAGSPDHQAVLETMRNALFAWMRETRDLGLIPEPEMVAIERDYGSGYAYLRTEEGQATMKRILKTVLDNEEGNLYALTTALKDESPSVRFWASLGLVNAGTRAKRVVTDLEKALWDAAGSVRVNAALALCHLGYESKALHTLMKALTSDENPVVRHYAALAFEDLGEKARKALPEIKQGRKDSYEYVQRVCDRLMQYFDYKKT